MSLAQRLQDTLDRFEDKTEGVLSTCVISQAQALMMASTNDVYDENVLQGMSVRMIRLAMETLELLLESPSLQSISLEEDDNYIFIQSINADYFALAVTDKSEFSGVRLSNLQKLVQQLKVAIER
ncbi:MAG: hypothetical protein ACXAE3_10600 [Candidatus Kariarchaeaceae archaeon]|jgi:predicted regulator of Ras-like GTPase activity (Roadblock/LC7/MglB family)